MAKVIITLQDKEGQKNVSIEAVFEPKPIMVAESLTAAQILGMALVNESRKIAKDLNGK